MGNINKTTTRQQKHSFARRILESSRQLYLKSFQPKFRFEDVCDQVSPAGLGSCTCLAHSYDQVSGEAFDSFFYRPHPSRSPCLSHPRAPSRLHVLPKVLLRILQTTGSTTRSSRPLQGRRWYPRFPLRTIFG